MNPTSHYYLAFNLGFPNAFDRAVGPQGRGLMVHGDCSSSGCYAMTDEQSQEIYTLGRDAFFGGQRSFQVQAYPFQMTATNMAKHRKNPDCPPGSASRRIRPLEVPGRSRRSMSATALCLPPMRRAAASTAGELSPTRAKSPRPSGEQKRQRDDADFEALANKGVATVAVRTGSDGGMHPTFLLKLRPQEAVFDNDGHYRSVTLSSIPLPAYVNPPRPSAPPEETTSAIASAQPEPKAKPAAMALAGTSKPPTIYAVTKPKPDTAKPEQAVAEVTAQTPATPPKPTPFDNTPPPATSGVMAGAAPVVSSSSVPEPLCQHALIGMPRDNNLQWPGIVPARSFIFQRPIDPSFLQRLDSSSRQGSRTDSRELGRGGPGRPR